MPLRRVESEPKSCLTLLAIRHQKSFPARRIHRENGLPIACNGSGVVKWRRRPLGPVNSGSSARILSRSNSGSHLRPLG